MLCTPLARYRQISLTRRTAVVSISLIYDLRVGNRGPQLTRSAHTWSLPVRHLPLGQARCGSARSSASSSASPPS
jgi:hypothetical protein